MMRRSLALLTLLTATSLFQSCALFREVTPPPHAGPFPYHRVEGEIPSFRRVVLMPLDTEVFHDSQRDVLARALLDAISKKNLFEIVPISERDLADIEMAKTRRRGIYSTKDLITISNRFGADGVLHGTMTQFQPAPQVRIGVRLHLLDCRNGRVPWATDVMLDASTRIVEQDVHNFHDTVTRESDSLIGHERILVSPRLFSEYASTRIASTIAAALRPEQVVSSPVKMAGKGAKP